MCAAQAVHFPLACLPLASRRLHPPLYSFLEPEYRRQLVLREVLGYHADIVCLQEVDDRVGQGGPGWGRRGQEG